MENIPKGPPRFSFAKFADNPVLTKNKFNNTIIGEDNSKNTNAEFEIGVDENGNPAMVSKYSILDNKELIELAKKNGYLNPPIEENADIECQQQYHHSSGMFDNIPQSLEELELLYNDDHILTGNTPINTPINAPTHMPIHDRGAKKIKFCRNCGTEFEMQDNFCCTCGKQRS